MIRMHDVASVQAAERAHAGELEAGILMERASTALARDIAAMLTAARGRVYGSRVVLLVGSGNNGGDALFAGARLAARGVRVDAIGISASVHSGGAAALVAAGGRLHTWGDDVDGHALISAADAIVDGIVGIGATGALREPGATLVGLANASEAVRIAVDVPSGVDADTGTVVGAALDADLTVTFAAAKPGLLIAPGKAYVGQLAVVDIGIDDGFDEPSARALQGIDAAAYVPEPAFDDYKYRRGVAGIAAGCPQYPGASLLCTSAAVAGDAGMVAYLDRADGLAPAVIARHPEIVIVAAADAPRVTAWACGSGFAGDAADVAAVDAVLRTSVPVILDAGALTALADHPELRALIRSRAAATVLTPHDGEFTRLGGDLAGRGRLRAARELAAALDAVIVLKGPGTVIAAPDGTTFIDIAGTAALATAGSGDVLSGVAAAVLAGAAARGELPDIGSVAEAAAAACWLHGTAGRLAAEQGAPVSAEGIAARLGAAIAVARRQPGE